MRYGRVFFSPCGGGITLFQPSTGKHRRFQRFGALDRAEKPGGSFLSELSIKTIYRHFHTVWALPADAGATLSEVPCGRWRLRGTAAACTGAAEAQPVVRQQSVTFLE